MELMWYHMGIKTSPTEGHQSTYFMTLTCIHIITYRIHFCFQMTIFHECNLPNATRTSTHCGWDFLYNILWADTCFMHEGTFSNHNSHLWAWTNGHAFCKCGYQVCFSVINIWVGILEADRPTDK
jgi:hypothetical protein